MYTVEKLLRQRSLDGNNSPLKTWYGDIVKSNISQERYLTRSINFGHRAEIGIKQMGAFIVFMKAPDIVTLVDRVSNNIIWSMNLRAFNGARILDPLYLSNEGVVGITISFDKHKKLLLLIKDAKIILEVEEDNAVTLSSIHIEDNVLIYKIDSGDAYPTIKIIDLTGEKEPFIYSPGFNGCYVEYKCNYCIVSRSPYLYNVYRNIYCVIDFISRDIVHYDPVFEYSALAVVNQNLLIGSDKKLSVMDMKTQSRKEQFILDTGGYISNIVYHHGVKLLVVTKTTPSGFSRIELHLQERDNTINQLYPVKHEEDNDLLSLAYNNSTAQIFCNNELVYFVINYEFRSTYGGGSINLRSRPYGSGIFAPLVRPVIFSSTRFVAELIIYDLKTKAIVKREFFEDRGARYLITAFENTVVIGLENSSKFSIRDYSQVNAPNHDDAEAHDSREIRI